MIQGGNKEVTKGGKELMRMADENGIEIVNTMWKDTIWTRTEGGKRSTIDYLLVEKNEIENVEEFEIDEDKLWTPYHVKKEQGYKTVYSDHNAIMVKFKWRKEENNKKDEKILKIMGKRSYERFRERLKLEKITELLREEDSAQEMYDRWSKAVLTLKRQCQVKINKKKETQGVRTLMRIKRRIKKLSKENNDIKLKKRQKLVTRHIYEEKQRKYSEKIKNTIESLRRNGGGMKEESFWEFRKKIQGKRQERRTAMKDKEGNITEQAEEIKEIYKEFYEELFEKPKKEESIEQEQEKLIMKKIEDIEKEGSKQKPKEIQRETIEKVIKTLKRGKSEDSEGWKNEMIIEGKEEMVDSLQVMFNKIMKEMSTPTQWEQVKIKSIYKNKGSHKEMKNRRGIFLTSIVGKVFEKVMMEEQRNRVRMSMYQNGGGKNRSAKDNWMAIMAIMDRNKKLGRDTYMIFADAEKCFDKLWLEDCVVDLVGIGMREREAAIVYKMNERAAITIKTPYGETEEIIADRIVKQGTVYGTQLCCCSTERVNEIGEKRPQTMISQNMAIEALVYVDDIGGAGTKENIMVVAECLRKMEQHKGFTFNAEKTNYVIVKTGKGRKENEEPGIELKRGTVVKAKEYKYLGNWIDEKGDIGRQITEIEKKVIAMEREIKRICSEGHLGRFSTEGRLTVYERTVVPVITYNLETWTNIKDKEWEQLEKIQGRMIKRLLQIPETTPTWGILKETGIWPIEHQVNYQRLMLLQNLLNSEENRLGRRIIESQREEGIEYGWYQGTVKVARKYGLEEDEVEKVTKKVWKRKVKEKIREEIEETAKIVIITFEP